MNISEEFERTIKFADEAVTHMRDSILPAYPKTYEVWYAHLSGTHPELSTAITDIYEKYGRISPGQIVHLHKSYIDKPEADDLKEVMNKKITSEAVVLEKIVHQSFENNRDFDQVLGQAITDLNLDLDPDSMKALIKRVTIETKNIQKQNIKLISQLRDAKNGIEALKQDIQEIRDESIMDQLTEIGNRRHFDRSLADTISSHALSGEAFCLIIADIDHFKNFNDKWGHQTGDQVLRLVSLAIKNNVKVDDIPCRYGGEEFAIILPKVNLEQARMVAERIRKTIAQREVIKRTSNKNLGRITISAGIAIFLPNDSADSLVHRADKCLYAAKNSGRNKVVTERDHHLLNVA